MNYSTDPARDALLLALNAGLPQHHLAAFGAELLALVADEKARALKHPHLYLARPQNVVHRKALETAERLELLREPRLCPCTHCRTGREPAFVPEA